MQFHRGDERKPVRDVVIAETTGSVFHVGLEMKNGVAKFGVAGTRNVRQFLDQVFRFASDEIGNQCVVQTRKQRAIAGEIAAVEERNREFRIIGIEFVTFRKLSSRGAELEAQVPKLLRKTPDRVFVFLFGFVGRVQE